MIFAFVAGLAIGQPTVSFENPGIRLELLIEELATQSGQSLECTTPLANEVLAVSFKDQSIETVRKQLATVLNATWEERDGRLWVRQTDEQKKFELENHKEQKRLFIQNFIDSAKQARPTNEWNAGNASEYLAMLYGRQEGGYIYLQDNKGRITAQEVYQRSPNYRALANLAALIKPEFFHLDRVETMATAYYSNDGIPDDDKLPISYEKVLDQFGREQSLFLGAMSEGTVLKTPFKLEIVGWPLEMRVFDRDWMQISSGTFFTREVGVFDPETETFTHSKEYNEVAEVLKSNQPALLEKAQKYRDVLLNADKSDPLGIYIGRSWLDFSQFARSPIIASLGELESDFNVKADVPKLMQNGLKRGMCRVDADGWILGRPIDPYENRALRADRKLIKRYSQLVLASNKRGLNLREIIEIADLGHRLFRETRGIPHSRILPSYYTGGALTTLYATITRSQGYVEKSFRLPATSFSDSVANVTRWFRNTNGFVQLTRDAKTRFITRNQRVVLPDGELAQMNFESRYGQEEAYVASFGRAQLEWTPAQCVEAYRGWLSNPNSYKGLSVRAGIHSALEFTLTLRDKQMVEKRYGPITPSGESFTFDRMPADIKSKLERLPRSGGN